MTSKEQTQSNDKTAGKQKSPIPVAVDMLTQQESQPEALIQRARSDPRLLSPRDVLQMQRISGNQAVAQMLTGMNPKTIVQAKLTVGAAGDKYEEEADQVASQVMRMPAPAALVAQRHSEEDQLQAKPLAESITPLVQRAAVPEEEELQAKSMTDGGAFTPGADFESSLASARSGGAPLPESTRDFMEQRIGANFSGVKVHTDAQSDQLNQSIQAKAFTTGQDVFFREGAYQPGSESGQELIAHELTHVVQQNGSEKIQRAWFGKKKKLSDESRDSNESGYVGQVKSAMVGIVKKIQEKDGSMQQTDNYINGDAGVNAYLLNQYNKAQGGGESEIWDKNDADPESRTAKLSVSIQKSGLLLDKYRNMLITKNKINETLLKEKNQESISNVAESKKMVSETASDRAIVEVYYNQLKNLKGEEKLQESEEMYMGPKDSAMGKEAKEILAYAETRQENVLKRAVEQRAIRTKLEKEGRISTTVIRAKQATGWAIANALLKTVTFGLMGVKKNRDKRGLVGGADYSSDGEQEKLKGKVKGGKAEFFTIYGEYCAARDEFKEKLNKRLALSIDTGPYLLSMSAAVLDVFKKLLGIVQSLFSSTAVMLSVASLIPGAAIALAPIIAFCSGMALVLALSKSAISVLVLSLNSLAQIFNDNPALFAELQGETAKSAVNVATESAGLAAGYGIASTGASGAGESYSDRLTFDTQDAVASGFDVGEMAGKKSTQVGAALATSVVPSVLNEGITASGNLDNNAMTYSQTVNKNRRIGKLNNKTVDLSGKDARETELIMKSVKATQEKLKSDSNSFYGVMHKFLPAPAPAVIPDDGDQEALEKSQKASSAGSEAENAAQNAEDIVKESVELSALVKPNKLPALPAKKRGANS